MVRLWERKSLLASSADALAAAGDDGYTPYARSTDGEGRPVVHLERPAPAALEAADEDRAEAAALPNAGTGATRPRVDENALLDALGIRALTALGDAGFTTSEDVLGAPRDRLAAVPGVGPATLDKIDALR